MTSTKEPKLTPFFSHASGCCRRRIMRPRLHPALELSLSLFAALFLAHYNLNLFDKVFCVASSTEYKDADTLQDDVVEVDVDADGRVRRRTGQTGNAQQRNHSVTSQESAEALLSAISALEQLDDIHSSRLQISSRIHQDVQRQKEMMKMLADRTGALNELIIKYNQGILLKFTNAFNDLAEQLQSNFEEDTAHVLENGGDEGSPMTNGADTEKNDWLGRVLLSELQQALNTTDHQSYINQDVLLPARDRIKALLASMATSVVKDSAFIKKNDSGATPPELVEASTGGCVSKEQASDMVISGIRSREKFILMDGKYDYALSSSGAVIVYANDMTSETYHPRVSDPAARHFWNIPWNIMKQMRSFLPSSTSLSDVGQSFYDATMTQWTLWRHSKYVHPPEEILSPHIEVGSCWPMKGRSGHVTIRFEQAIHIHSIVLDHLSPALARNRGNKYISSSSAIRSFHVVGYGSCENKAFNSSLSKAEKSMCAILGFDISNRFELGHFEYSRPVLLNERQKGRINNDHDIDGSSLHEAEKAYPGTYQLFATPRKYSESIMTNAKQETEAETYDFIEESLDYANDDNSEQERGGSCTLSSCSASPSQEQAQHEQDIAVKAITVAIGDNWGNDDYTCIYRLGVYGESAP